jgi:hypothetical protein
MVLIKLGNRAEIKKNLKACFEAVESKDYARAKEAINKLRFSLRKYYITRGKTIEKFEDLFEEAIDLIDVATNGIYKKSLMEEVLDKITLTLRGEIPKDPNAHLQEIFEELRYLFGCEWRADNAGSIIECIDEINTLKNDFPGNNYFSSMSQQLANCIPILITVSKTEHAPTVLVEKLTDKFADVFSSVQRVLIPPMRLNITREQLMDNIQDGVSIKDIADGTGMSEVEIRNMITGTNDDASESDDQ